MVVVRVRDAKFRSPVVCMARSCVWPVQHPPSGVQNHTGQWVSRLNLGLNATICITMVLLLKYVICLNLQVNLNTAMGQVGGIYVTGQLTMRNSTVVIVV